MRKLSAHDDLDRVVGHVLGNTQEARRFKRQITERITFGQFGPDFTKISGPLAQARADLFDSKFVRAAIRNVLMALLPGLELPSKWKFEITHIDNDQFLVGTNLDFKQLNEQYHKHIPPTHSSLSPAYLLGFLLTARFDLYFSATHMAELVASDVTSRIIQEKFRLLLTKREKNAEALRLFQNVTLPEGRTLREAINSGERSFSEFLTFLEHSTKFREWLQDRNPDSDLLQEYFRAVTAENWINKLPSKGMRFAFTTGMGLAAEAVLGTGGLAVGAATGIAAADTFLLDRLLKGWRPNQFVDELKNFTRS